MPSPTSGDSLPAAALVDQADRVTTPRFLDEALATGHATTLAEVTTSPLGLWLVRVVFLDTHRDPTALTDTTFPTPAALHDHLLDELIPALTTSRPPLPRRRRHAPDTRQRPAHQHRPKDVRRWLTTLAEQLRDTETRDWRWWRLALDSVTTRGARFVFRTIVGLAFGLTFGLAFGLAGGQTFGLALGLLVGLLVGLLLGIGAEPRHANSRLQGRILQLVRRLAGGLAGGLALGLVLGLTISPKEGLTQKLVDGLTFSLPAGLAGGLTNFLRSSDIASRSVSPVRSFQGDRAQAAIEVLTFGVASCLAWWWASGNLAGGLAFGLACGLAIGAVDTAWFVFLCAALRHTMRRPRRLPAPWRMIPMLEDCHRLGLLRAVGPVYQFRHAQLQDHLAPPAPPPAP